MVWTFVQKADALGEGRRENKHPLFLEHKVRDWQDREAVTFQTHSYRKPTLSRKGAKNKEHCRREALKGSGQKKIRKQIEEIKENTHAFTHTHTHNSRAFKRSRK